MRWNLPERLRTAAGHAIEAGLGYLDTVVDSNGAWPSVCHRSHDLTGAATVEHSVFVAASGVLILEACDSRRAARIRTRTRDFILSRIERPGVWRYMPLPDRDGDAAEVSPYPPLAADLDSTSLCSLALEPQRHPWLFLGRNVKAILSNRDGEGRFLTWIASRGPLGRPNDADTVVNANVVACLGDRAETRAAQRWLETLIEEKRESGASIWYDDPLDVYYCLGRAMVVAAPAFEKLRPTLADRIPGADDLGDALRAAQALSALDMLGAAAPVSRARRYLEQLLDTQHPHGGWPACLVWRGPRGLPFTNSSAALTTAYCIEALTRLTRAGQ